MVRARGAFDSEKGLGPPVIRWLEDHRWDVYQEVQSPDSGHVADIVATLGTLVCVVELKRSLSFDVVAQARAWRHLAHWTFVAVPYLTNPTEGRRLGIDYLHEVGIGVMICHPGGPGWEANADVWHHPHLQRSADAATLRGVLKPEHKTFAVAGSPHGRHWSPFKETCSRIRGFVAEHPGASVAEVVANIKHHYPHDRSACTCLLHWGNRGLIHGVKLVRDGRRVRFYATDERTADAEAVR